MNKEPSASGEAKLAGLKGLTETAKIIAEDGENYLTVKRRLELWFRKRPKLFNACILYAKKMRDEK